MDEKITKCYKASLNVINLYDILNDVLIDNSSKYDDFIFILNELKLAIVEEDNIYSCLNLNDIKEFIDKIKLDRLLRDYSFVDVRVSSKLAYFSEILNGDYIDNNGLFSELDDDFKISIKDLISSKISIDLYRLIRTKIDSLSLSDSKSLKIANKMKEEDVQQFIYKISLRVLGEKLAISNLFNIYKIKDIDFSNIESIIFDNYGVDIDIINYINKEVYKNIIGVIDILKTLNINSNDCYKIYDNLVYTSQIEVLIQYLNKEELEEILGYLNQINTSNKLVMSNIKKILKKRISNI